MQSEFFTVYRTARRGGGFDLFCPAHVLWLAAGALFIASVVCAYRKSGAKGRRAILFSLASIIAADELSKHAFLIFIGEDSIDYLPLHLCSIGLFVCAAYAIHPNKLCGEFLYAVCLPGTVAALLFPGWSALPPGSFITIHSFSYHILLAAFPAAILAGGDHRPSVRRLPACAAILAAMSVPLWFFNKHFNTNFFFLNSAGKSNPLSLFVNLFGETRYVLGLPIIAAVLWFFMYLPFIIAERRKNNCTS